MAHRTALLTCRAGDCAFFVYDFAKNWRDNIVDRKLKALKLLASALPGWTPEQAGHALREFDATSLPPVRRYTADEVGNLRLRCRVSQAVFAA